MTWFLCAQCHNSAPQEMEGTSGWESTSKERSWIETLAPHGPSRVSLTVSRRRSSIVIFFVWDKVGSLAGISIATVQPTFEWTDCLQFSIRPRNGRVCEKINVFPFGSFNADFYIFKARSWTVTKLLNVAHNSSSVCVCFFFFLFAPSA